MPRIATRDVASGARLRLHGRVGKPWALTADRDWVGDATRGCGLGSGPAPALGELGARRRRLSSLCEAVKGCWGLTCCPADLHQAHSEAGSSSGRFEYRYVTEFQSHEQEVRARLSAFLPRPTVDSHVHSSCAFSLTT